MTRAINVRKGNILIPAVLYPILRVVVIALFIFLLFTVYIVYVTGGQNQIVDIINNAIQKVP